ncbi:MAG: hypothetical protein AAB897_02870 [Patescibacteria group bacterium]
MGRPLEQEDSQVFRVFLPMRKAEKIFDFLSDKVGKTLPLAIHLSPPNNQIAVPKEHDETEEEQDTAQSNVQQHLHSSPPTILSTL